MKKNWIPKIKWTKGGTKLQQSEFGGWIPIEKSALAVFVTPSLKEILNTFGEDILILKSRGEKQIESNKIGLENLGIRMFRNDRNSFDMNYDTYFTKVNKHDNLTKSNITKITSYLEGHQIQDCSVEFLIIRIEDDELKKIIEDYYQVKIGSNIFYATFELSMCEGEIDREIWNSTPYNYDILKDLKFKHSILHCVRLIDDGQIWNIKKNQRKYFIDWKPREDKNKVSPEEIAHALMVNLKPYGYVKKYKLGSDEKLILTKMF